MVLNGVVLYGAVLDGVVLDDELDDNFVFGDIIETVYVWQLSNPEKELSASDAIIDEAIVAFDESMVEINAKNVDNKKIPGHLKLPT